MKVTFTAKAHSPAQGFLYACDVPRDGLYFPNDQRRDIPTGVDVDIPQGVTVEIQGLYENEQNRLAVIPRHIDGPWSGPLFVTIVNNSPRTHVFDAVAKIASIRAYKTPTLLPWIDETPEPEPLPTPPPSTLVSQAKERRDRVGPSIFEKQA
jgi:dUTPase